MTEKEMERNVMCKTRGLMLTMMVLILAGALGCQGTPADLQPVEISLNGVDVVFGGTSAIVLEADFTVNNPNSYQVTVKDPEYEFWTTFSMMDVFDLILHALLPLAFIFLGIRKQRVQKDG